MAAWYSLLESEFAKRIKRRKMTEQEFCTWLQGYLQDKNVKKLNEEQVKTIRSKLRALGAHPIPPKPKVVTTYPSYQIYK